MGLQVLHKVWGKLCVEVIELLRVKGVGGLRKRKAVLEVFEKERGLYKKPEITEASG